MPVVWLSLVMALTPHLFLDTEAARAYIGRWKPQVVGDTVVSLTGIASYTRAMTRASENSCVGLLCNERNVAYVLQRFGDGDNALVAVLWNTPTASVEDFRDLREWYAHYDTRPPHVHLLDEDERDLWSVSACDA